MKLAFALQRITRGLFLLGGLSFACTLVQGHDGRMQGGNEPSPLVIGHRGGGSGYLPEHTLEAYALGIELGADYVEPDLVATKDGHLIARHEPNLIATTNVLALPQFADRRRTVVLDGIPTDGFWASDFTLAEIKQLGAIQPIAERGQQFDGRFKIPTLELIIGFVKRKSREKDRQIGIYPETKHPTYHQSIGLALEDRLLRVLTRAGWNHRHAPVIIQSFETANLKYLNKRTSLRLVQLVDADDIAADGTITYAPPFDKPYDWVVSGRAGTFGDLVTPAGLAEVRTYADGIGPWKYYLQTTACKTLDATGTKCADANGDGVVAYTVSGEVRLEISRVVNIRDRGTDAPTAKPTASAQSLHQAEPPRPTAPTTPMSHREVAPFRAPLIVGLVRELATPARHARTA